MDVYVFAPAAMTTEQINVFLLSPQDHQILTNYAILAALRKPF